MHAVADVYAGAVSRGVDDCMRITTGIRILALGLVALTAFIPVPLLDSVALTFGV